MSFDEFMNNLESDGLRLKGRSYAFWDFEDWVIAFIRLGGKFQRPGKIAFVICARPKEFFGLEGHPLEDSTEPHDYPLKLVLDEFQHDIRYESKLLHYDHDVLPEDSDWSGVYSILKNGLPEQLQSLGVPGLRQQIASQNELGYVEKIWLAEGSDA